MPLIYLTPAEQQRLQAILKDNLSYLNDTADSLRQMVRDVAANASALGWNYEQKARLQKPAHAEIKKIEVKIKKHVCLLKKIKSGV